MALVGELRYIQELHDKGRLTGQEYTDAKAALLKPDAQSLGEEKKPSGSSTAVLVGVAALIIVVVLIVAFNQPTQNIQSSSSSPSASSTPASTIYRPSTGNVAHDRLLALSESDQALYLGIAAGEGCQGVEAFNMGMEPKSLAAFWSIRCSNSKSYEVMINADAGGTTTILECSVLKFGGGELFRKTPISGQVYAYWKK